MMNSQKGTFYVVATPIGNLDDMTFRAISVLKKVGIVFCEDTRKTKFLLAHFDINTPLESYYKDVEVQKLPKILEKLRDGVDVALVSDAGMPLISDPGDILIKALIAEGVTIIPVPGACAFTTALSVSGLDTHRFIFEGFFPKKKNERIKKLTSLAQESRTIIFYESPHRIVEAVKAVESVLGNRRIVVAKELTKIYEHVLRGTASQVLEAFEKGDMLEKGEFVLLVEGNTMDLNKRHLTEAELIEEIKRSMELLNMSKKEAVNFIAKELNMPKKVVYKASLSI